MDLSANVLCGLQPSGSPSWRGPLSEQRTTLKRLQSFLVGFRLVFLLVYTSFFFVFSVDECPDAILPHFHQLERKVEEGMFDSMAYGIIICLAVWSLLHLSVSQNRYQNGSESSHSWLFLAVQDLLLCELTHRIIPQFVSSLWCLGASPCICWCLG